MQTMFDAREKKQRKQKTTKNKKKQDNKHANQNYTNSSTKSLQVLLYYEHIDSWIRELNRSNSN